MSRYQRLSATVGALLLTATLMSSPGAANAGTVTLAAGTSSIKVGDSFTLQVKMSGLSAAPGDSLSGFDLNLKFDNTVSAFVGVDFTDAGSGINQLNQPEAGAFPFIGEAALTGADTVNAFGLSGNSPSLLDAQQLDAFVFLTLRFTALAESSSALFSLNPSDPGLLFADSDSGALAVDFDISRLALNIGPGTSNPVSEPPALALALAALLLMGRFRRTARSPKQRAGIRSPSLLAGTGLLLAAGLASAAPEPAAKQGSPATVQTTAQSDVTGRVVEVQGQRIKLRSASGSEVWYTVSAPITASIVNKQARGQARPLGDALLLDTPVFD